MDDAHVEKNLTGFGYLIELPQGIIELVVVIPGKSLDPSLDFLGRR